MDTQKATEADRGQSAAEAQAAQVTASFAAVDARIASLEAIFAKLIGG